MNIASEKTDYDSESRARSERQLNYSRLLPLALLIVTVIMVLSIRIRLLDVPLERDEGEYAYAGQLLLQGKLPYNNVYNMKMPGIYAAYALILLVFGQSSAGIHAGLVIVNVAAIVLLFILGKRLCDTLCGAVAAASFAILSVSFGVHGLFANAEHFVIVPALGGIFVLLSACNSNRIRYCFAAGLLFGIAFMLKQHGIVFALFGTGYLLWDLLCCRKMPFLNAFKLFSAFVAGLLLPFCLTCLVFLIVGNFNKFWFWTFIYAKTYASTVSFSESMKLLQDVINRVTSSVIPIWGLGTAGIAVCLWDTRMRGKRLFVIGFLIFSFLTVCPGLYFRPHYFIMFLPALALMAGSAVSGLRYMMSHWPGHVKEMLPVILAAAVLVSTVWMQRDFLFFQSPVNISQTTYKRNHFPEAVVVADYIRKHSDEKDRIVVIGSEPQIYFYSQRRSATGYIYTYALMEGHDYALTMQHEMIREIESAMPRFIVYVNIRTSWLKGPWSEQLIFQWLEYYLKDHYQMVGVADIISEKQTEYRWGKDVQGYMPRSKQWFGIFEKK